MCQQDEGKVQRVESVLLLWERWCAFLKVRTFRKPSAKLCKERVSAVKQPNFTPFIYSEDLGIFLEQVELSFDPFTSCLFNPVAPHCCGGLIIIEI